MTADLDFLDRTVPDRIAEGVPPTQRYGTRDAEILEDRERRIQEWTRKVEREDNASRMARVKWRAGKTHRQQRTCAECGVGLLIHDENWEVVAHHKQVRHIYSCDACGRWFWRRVRVW